MSEFLMFYAPIIVLVVSVVIAFWLSAKDNFENK